MLSKTCSEVKAGLEGPCIQHIENTCLCLDCSESGDCLLCPKHGCPVYPQDHNFIADVEFQGNNGGDYVKISQTVGQSKESCLNIEVGHCCVVTLRAVVPVEFLTSLITKFMFTDTEGMSRATDDKLSDFAREIMDEWPKDFVDERLSKIVEGGFWNA